MTIFENIIKIEASAPELSFSPLNIVLSGFTLTTRDEKPYLELEEMSYCCLNKNDYGLNRVDFEFRFDGADKYKHKKCAINCVAIRDEKGIIYKQPPQKAPIGYTKVTKDSKCTVGISYHFENKEKIQRILDGKGFVIEFALALKGMRNVYQVSCVLVKQKNKWILEEGNTYKVYKFKHIDNYIH